MTVREFEIQRPGESPEDRIRRQILDLANEYMEAKGGSEFVPGETYVPCSGKVLDVADLRNLLDASLDMWLTAGSYAERFEARLAEMTGHKHAKLTVSGSAANLLAFTALTSPKLGKKRIEPDAEVITVACGFPTTVAPIVQNHCVPVFVDVDLETANVDVARLRDAIGPNTRAIMLAHTLGNPFDVAAVSQLAKEHDLYLIEDCCDAFGASYEGKPVGTFGDLATLSFYPAHHITMGEGGAVMTNRNLYATVVESFRDWGRDCWCLPGAQDTCGKRFDWQLGDLPHGYDHKFTFSHLGYNLKVSDMQAAVGLSQLDKVDDFIRLRRKNFDTLKRLFLEHELDGYFDLPKATAGTDPSWFGFLLTVKQGVGLDRRDVVSYLEDHNVGTRLLFGGNLTRQPAFKDVKYKIAGSLENTDRIMDDSFWIGVWPGIDEPRLAYIVDTFKNMVTSLKAS